jgi:hypothetical protein
MLPFFVPLAENDVSARLGVEESFVTNVTSLGTQSILTGGRTGLRATSRDEGAFYGLDLSGYYGRLTTVTLGADDQAPRNNYSGSAGAHASWELGPMTQLYVDGAGFIASRLAVRSNNPLAARDPFLKDRVEYALDDGLAIGGAVSRRTSYRLGAGYVGAGGVQSSEPDAVGPDLHGAKATFTLPYELGPRTYLGPDLRYAYTHFYHALLDSEFHRGVVDVHAGTAALALTRIFDRRTMAMVAGGVTVATPPTILGSTAPIVSPDVRVTATYLSRSSRATAGYSFAYTSLGPRIGYGHRHQGTVEIATRPIDGSKWRDMELRWIGSVSYGSAPMDIVLLTLPTAGALPTQNGTLTTFTTIAGAHLDLPIVPGVVLTGGYDLEFVKASFDPTPPGGEPSSQVIGIASVGITGVLSTNRRDLVKPEQQDVDERAGSSPYGNQDVDAQMRDPYAPVPTAQMYGAPEPPPPAPIDEHSYTKPELPRSDDPAPATDPTIVDTR